MFKWLTRVKKTDKVIRTLEGSVTPKNNGIPYYFTCSLMETEKGKRYYKFHGDKFWGDAWISRMKGPLDAWKQTGTMGPLNRAIMEMSKES